MVSGLNFPSKTNPIRYGFLGAWTVHGEFLVSQTRLGGTSLKAAALLSALRAQVPEAAMTVDVSYPMTDPWCWY